MNIAARFRSSLTYPIAATLVLVTVVPMVLVGLLLTHYNRSHLETVEKRYLGRQAVSLAGEIALFMDGHRTQLVSTARTLEVAEGVDVSSFQELLQGIGNQQGSAFVYLEIVPLNAEGAFVLSPQLKAATKETLDPMVREAYRAAVQGDQIETLVIDLPEGDSAKAIIAYPLRSGAGAIWGTLTGVVDLEPLRAKVSSPTYAGLLVSLVDRAGRVVISSRPNLRRMTFTASPLVQDLLRSQQRITRTYKHPIDFEAGEVLGSGAPVAEFGLGVVMERPTSEAYAPLRVQRQRTLGLSVLAALVSLGIGYLLSRKLTIPLQDLASTSSEIAQGNLTVRANVQGEDELARLGGNFNNMAGNIEALVRRLKQALRQNQELFLETIKTLAAAIDAKDPYTRGHSERVSSYSMAISRHLGLGQEEVFRVHIAAILHDVGKLGVRDGILNKPGGLSDDEFEVMRQHPAIGAQIMSPIRMLKDIIPGIRNHHETWDGTGYPDRMKGEEIPMVARIIGVADTFDAMTTTRPYQQAMTLDYVLNKMRSMSGSRFDPTVVEAFIAAVEAGDISPPIQEQPLASSEVS
jgi:HD-GYP domain-containing protein (c-di-GMP phosphodiesterase class II)